MGYDTDRFENSEQIDKDLFCPICRDILQDPVYFRDCEHSFCRKCITSYIKIKEECPVDGNSCKLTDIKPIVRFMKKSLNQLRYVIDLLLCPFMNHGIIDFTVYIMVAQTYARMNRLKITRKNVFMVFTKSAKHVV